MIVSNVEEEEEEEFAGGKVFGMNFGARNVE